MGEMKKKSVEKQTILTSEIKKGDVVFMGGGKHYEADSDAYKHRGIWSFDIIAGEWRYGFQNQDTEIQIRKRK